jgi:hypothetical protein
MNANPNRNHPVGGLVKCSKLVNIYRHVKGKGEFGTVPRTLPEFGDCPKDSPLLLPPA